MRLEMRKWAMRRTRHTRLVVRIPRANYLAKNSTVGCCLSVPGVESLFAKKMVVTLIQRVLVARPARRSARDVTRDAGSHTANAYRVADLAIRSRYPSAFRRGGP